MTRKMCVSEGGVRKLPLPVLRQHASRSVVRRWALALALPLMAMAAGAWAQSADLVLANHIVAPDPVPAGGTATITMTVQNNGAGTATNVKLTDTIPPGSTFVSMSASNGGACTGSAPYECTWPSVSFPDSRTVTLLVNLPTSGVWPNAAQVTSDTPDPNAGNNALARNITAVAAANLRINATSSVGAGTIAAGTPYYYTLVVDNNGPDALPAGNNPKVTFNVPAGTSLTSVPTGTGWACTPSTGYPRSAPDGVTPGDLITCTRTAGNDALATSSSYPAITVPAVGNVQGTVQGTFTVQSDFPDGNASDNTGTVPVDLSNGTDMSITKTASLAAVGGGTQATFTLTARQNGGVAPTGVVVTDTLPAGMTYVSHSAPAPWVCDFGVATANTLTCSYSGTYNGGPFTDLPSITLVASVTGAGDIPNTGIVTAAPPDPVGTNNTSTVTVNNSADLRIDKSASISPVVVGQSYNWNVVVRNYGPMQVLAGQTITTTETLPAGMVVESAVSNANWTCTGTYTVGGAAVSYPTNGDAVTLVCTHTRTSNLGFSAINGVAAPTLSIPVHNSAAGALNNHACLALSGAGPVEAGDSPVFQRNCVDTGITGTDAGTNWADLSIIKSASPNPVVVGQPLTYTLTVANSATSPVSATNVMVYDVVNNLLSSAGTPGLVSITATPGSCTPAAPANVTSASIECAVGTLAPGASATITIVVQPNNATAAVLDRVNTASVNSLDIGDPTRGNNSSTTHTNVLPRVDATVTKTVNPSSNVRVGQPTVYTITARNAGPSTTNTLTITDVMPPNTAFVSVGTPSNGGTCASVPAVDSTGGTLSCSWSNVAANAQRTVVFTVRPLLAALNTTLSNTVNVAVGPSDTETDTTNNSSTASTNVIDSLVDILVQKTDTVDPVALGDDTEYIVTVRNAGPSIGTDLVVTDTFPKSGNTARFSYQGNLSATIAGNPVTPSCTEPAVGALTGTLTCTFPTLGLDVANQVVLRYRMRAESIVTAGAYSGTQSNHAEVRVAEHEVQMTNNAVDEDTTTRRDAPAAGSEIDLSMTKTTSAARAYAGTEFDYTLTVTNQQPAGSGRDVTAANGATVTDTLPAGLSFVSAAGCSYDTGSRQVACIIPGLAAGASMSFTIRVRVDSPYTGPSTLNNTACVDMPGDPVAGNNCSVAPKGMGPLSSTSIPTLSEWALILLSLMLFGFAAHRMQRTAGRRR